jgi:hypothetical protein
MHQIERYNSYWSIIFQAGHLNLQTLELLVSDRRAIKQTEDL